MDEAVEENSVPAEILENIKKEAARRFPEDNHMQSYTIKEELKDYKKFENYQDNSIPQVTLKKFKKLAIQQHKEFGLFYDLLLKDVKDKVEEYKNLQKRINKSTNLNSESERIKYDLLDGIDLPYGPGGSAIINREKHNTIELAKRGASIKGRFIKEWQNFFLKFYVKIEKEIPELYFFKEIGDGLSGPYPAITFRAGGGSGRLTFFAQLNTEKQEQLEKISNKIEKTFREIFPEDVIISCVKINDKQWELLTYFPIIVANDEEIAAKSSNDVKTNIVDFPIENLSKIDIMVINYFGKENINKLFLYQLKGSYGIERNVYPSFTIFLEKSQYNTLPHFEVFLQQTATGMKGVYVDIAHSTQEVINEYWTKECEIEYKKYLSKYGFFAHVEFFLKELSRVMGHEKYEEFMEKIWKKEKYFYDFTIILYLGSLRFLWGLKPEIVVKKCKYCGEEFIPIVDFKGEIVKDIEEIHPSIESVNDIDFCRLHILPYYIDMRPKPYNGKSSGDESNQIVASKEKMIDLLKKLIAIVGVIPASDFKRNIDYLKNFDKEKFDEAIILLNDIPDYEEYVRVFGSWFKTLIAAKVLEGDTRKMPRGYMCLAEDGHDCLSLAEKNIDDWMHRHGIKHEKEPRYPGEGNFRGDWKSGEYFIEYWGLKGQEDYDNKILIKREIAKKYKISLIEIAYEDLNNLNEKLKILLENKDN